MISELIQETQTVAFEEFGNICITGLSWRNELQDLELLLEMNNGEDDGENDVRQKWKLLCRNEMQHRINLGCSDTLSIVNEHPLLWQFTETFQSLWFSGSCQNFYAVIGELWHAHQQKFGDWLPMSHFLNDTGDFARLIGERHGKLAEGPEPIIQIYKAVLEKHGFKASTTSYPQLGRVKSQEREMQLLLVGTFYVIARSLEAERIS